MIVALNCSSSVALLVAQPARDLDVDDDAQVAVAVALQARHALAAQRDHLARLGAGRDLDASRARRASAPRRLAPSAASGAGTSSTVIEVVALAHEALVLAHARSST